jgi:hypothetical protein
MRKSTMILTLVAAIGTAVMAAPLLHAQDNQPSASPARPPGMMGGQGGGMMGMGGGMMGMMQQMTEMMSHCNRMMSEHRPRGGEREPASEPGKNG